LLAWDNRRYHNGEDIDVGFNGHVNFSLDGPKLHAAYLDLNNTLLLTEDWYVDLETGVLHGPQLAKVLQDPSLHMGIPFVTQRRVAMTIRAGGTCSQPQRPTPGNRIIGTWPFVSWTVRSAYQTCGSVSSSSRVTLDISRLLRQRLARPRHDAWAFRTAMSL